MIAGRDMIKACEEGDIETFHQRLTSIDFESRKMVFWHATQGFKKAIENRRKEMVDYLIHTINIDLEHMTFDKLLHFAIA